jgi:hypothetical protein
VLPRLFCSAVLLCGLSPRGAAAVVLYDTYPFGQSTPSRGLGAVPGPQVRNFQYADPFTVSGGDHQLESLTLRLHHEDGASGDFRIWLRADQGGQPGPVNTHVLEEWIVTDPFDDPTDVVLTSVAEPLLENGKTYWVNVKILNGISWASWLVAGELSTAWRYSDGGAANPTWLSPAVPRPLGLLTVQAPEPSQALLVVAGAAALVACARSGGAARAARSAAEPWSVTRGSGAGPKPGRAARTGGGLGRPGAP